MGWKAVKEFLKPSKPKVLLSIIIPPVFNVIFNVMIALYYLLTKATPNFYPPTFVSVVSHEFLSYVLFPFLFQMTFCYPMACSIITIYSAWKSRNLTRKVLFYTVFLIIFFNPLVFPFFRVEIIRLTAEPCGVLIGNVIPGSPAENVGISSGLAIYYINRRPIYNATSLREIMENTKPRDLLVLEVMTPNRTKHAVKVILANPPEGLDVKGGFLGIANLTTYLRPYCKLSR